MYSKQLSWLYLRLEARPRLYQPSSEAPRVRKQAIRSSRRTTRWSQSVRVGYLMERAPRSMEDQVILIRGDRITEIAPNVNIPGRATMIDLGDATVLPGLIDTHLHIMGFGSPAQQWIVGVQAAQ